MTTSTTADLANVPQPAVVALPPKAVTADAWIPDGGRFYRVFEAAERHLGESIRVWAPGCQWDDGTVASGTTELWKKMESTHRVIGGRRRL
jgi:hypothetical protein